MIKILFVTTYPLEYNTSANIRNLGIIEGLLENGCSVSTFSTYPTDRSLYDGNLLGLPFDERYWIGRIEKGKSDKLPTKMPNFISRGKGCIYQVYSMFNVYDRRRSYLREINKNLVKSIFDIIISSSDPKSAHLYAEKLLKGRTDFAKSWIQYWGDPFSNDISTKRFFKNRLIAREEKRLLNMASKAVYVSPFTADDIKNKYPVCSEKIQFLPIPYRLSQSDSEEVNFSKPIIGYLGDYSSRNRNIVPLYKAIKSLKLDSYIIGNSDLDLAETPEIIIKCRMDGNELKKITKDINILTCVCNLRGSQIPGKIYHYVNTRKPVIVIIDGDNKEELKNYIAGFDRFYICENSEISISNCIKKVIEEKKNFETPELLDPVLISTKFTKT